MKEQNIIEYEMMPKIRKGDIIWWENPLEKSEANYLYSNAICGKRPVLVLSAKRSHIQFAPCTTQLHNYRIIRLLNNEKTLFSIKNSVITEMDDSRFQDRIEISVSDADMEAIRQQLPAMIMANSIPSVNLNIHFTPIPLGRMIEVNGEYFVIINRLSNIVSVIPCIETTVKAEGQVYLTKGQKIYRVVFEKYKKTDFINLKDYKLIGGISDQLIMYLNAKVQDVLELKSQRLLSKISELENDIDKIASLSRIFSKYEKSKAIDVIDIDIENNNNGLNTLSSNESLKKLSASLSEKKEEEQPVVVKEETSQQQQQAQPVKLTGSSLDAKYGLAPSKSSYSVTRNGSLIVDLNSGNKPIVAKTAETPVDEYYKPSRSKYLVDIVSKDDIIKALSEDSAIYMGRTGKPYYAWYYRRQKLVECIDWSKAPYELRSLKGC